MKLSATFLARLAPGCQPDELELRSCQGPALARGAFFEKSIIPDYKETQMSKLLAALVAGLFSATVFAQAAAPAAAASGAKKEEKKAAAPAAAASGAKKEEAKK